MENFKFTGDFITLAQFLKTNSYISSGGETLNFMESNDIKLDGETITAKRKKMYPDNVLQINDIFIKLEKK